MIGLQPFDFAHELRGFFEATVNAGKANIGHFIDLPQTLHDPFADSHAGNFALIFIADFVHDLSDEVFDDLGADRAFLTGFLEPRKELFFGEFLASSIAFHDHKSLMFNLFVSCEAVFALQTLTAATNGRALAGGARINDLIVLIAALWTAHNAQVNRYIM